MNAEAESVSPGLSDAQRLELERLIRRELECACAAALARGDTAATVTRSLEARTAKLRAELQGLTESG